MLKPRTCLYDGKSEMFDKVPILSIRHRNKSATSNIVVIEFFVNSLDYVLAAPKLWLGALPASAGIQFRL
jgi:hypothetical protein